MKGSVRGGGGGEQGLERSGIKRGAKGRVHSGRVYCLLLIRRDIF